MRTSRPRGNGGVRPIPVKRIAQAAFGDRTIKVGQKFDGRVVSVQPYGMFINIGLPKDGLLKQGRQGLKLGDKVRVEIANLINDPLKGNLIELRRVEAENDVQQNKMPAAVQASIIGWYGGTNCAGELLIINRTVGYALPELLGAPGTGEGAIKILRTGIRGGWLAPQSEVYEICCAESLLPIAQVLVKTIGDGRTVAVWKPPMPPEPRRGMYPGIDASRSAVFEVKANEYLGPEGSRYAPSALLVVPKEQAVSVQNAIHEGDLSFRLAIKDFNPSWTAWDLIVAMARGPLLAERVEEKI